MKAVLVCNGAMEDYAFHKEFLDGADLIICVDGGARHFKNLGMLPHVLLGDFDSISGEEMDLFIKNGVEVVKFPVEKDFTDSELAITYAAEKGCTSLVILGGLGSRIDHSLANIFLLKKALDLGIKGIIANEANEVALVKDSIKMAREEGVKITLLPLFEKAEGVTTKGLYYPLGDATLELGQTWGVSNEFVAEEAEVFVKKGLLLVIKSRD